MVIFIDRVSFRKFCTSELLTILALTAKLSSSCPILDKSAFTVRSLESVSRELLSSALEGDEVELEMNNSVAGSLSGGGTVTSGFIEKSNI